MYDALGKAYIIKRALDAARTASSHVEGVVVNIGGDIEAWGRRCEINIAPPEQTLG